MPQPDSDTARFHASLARATADPAFFDRFYHRFIEDSGDIARIFRGKDMTRIHRKLRTTLEMLAGSADEQPGLGMYLDLLGRMHERLAIRPEHFDRWRASLIATAAESDPDFDPETRRAWEGVIDGLIAKMGAARADSGSLG
jgi:hemoglobin-like flavoprotein